jgi:hypothetical protein
MALGFSIYWALLSKATISDLFQLMIKQVGVWHSSQPTGYIAGLNS